MKRQRSVQGLLAGILIAEAFCLALFAADNPRLGGPRGVVRSATGEALEGMMVQLISQKNSVRTTVYTDPNGRYEFPKLESGSYTLRIARPLEFMPYVRESVAIDGAAQLDDIVLQRLADSQFLPPTSDIAAQLTGSEWMMNLPGTAQEKRMFGNSCGYGCHSYQQIFRNRYDERSWHVIVDRMMHSSGSLIVNRNTAKWAGEPRSAPDNFEVLAKWLARVRGPESQDPPLVVLPRPEGAATRVIVTEYELPRLDIAPHDLTGDSQGHIWYSSHRTPYVGELDPRTGVVTEHRLPSTPGANPGTHGIIIDENGMVFLSENWSHKLTRLDSRTGESTSSPVARPGVPMNSPAFGNFARTPDGFLWDSRDGAINKMDPKTGQAVKEYPLKKARGAYGNEVSADGKFFAGGVSTGYVIFLDIQKGEVVELPTQEPDASPAKGGFDPEGNAWFGGRGGRLIEFEAKTRHLREYTPPTPYVTFYEALADKNGEVWGGEIGGGRMARFIPRTERWIEYVLPEPYAHDRRTWIDNSTNPVTVWYVDQEGYIVRVQPLE